MAVLAGGCHCGALTMELTTSRDPATLALRDCQCTFCRKHGARNTVDRDGQLRIVAEAGALVRYRFAFGTSDFLVCGRCGVYICCVIDDKFATINTRALAWDFTQPTEDKDWSSETAGSRRERRLQTWTPTAIEVRV
jgi:hypothetical protein